MWGVACGQTFEPPGVTGDSAGVVSASFDGESTSSGIQHERAGEPKSEQERRPLSHNGVGNESRDCSQGFPLGILARWSISSKPAKHAHRLRQHLRTEFEHLSNALQRSQNRDLCSTCSLPDLTRTSTAGIISLNDSQHHQNRTNSSPAANASQRKSEEPVGPGVSKPGDRHPWTDHASAHDGGHVATASNNDVLQTRIDDVEDVAGLSSGFET